MIALLGNLSRDHLPGKPPQVGGGAYHGARALQRLRVPARVVTRCAVADRTALVTPLIRLGTPVRYVPGESTATFTFHYEGDVRHMQVDALGDVWQPSDVPELPTSARWVHVAPLARSDFPTETLALLARRRRVSFDGQGLVRAPATGPLQLDDDFDRDVLRHIWVLKLSDEEAGVIGDVEALGVREVVVTHGSRGATLITGAGREEIRARPVEGDPTGSGDMFTTTYVIARSGGFGPAAAARRATAVVAAILAGR